MQTVAILGAGDLGGVLARTLAGMDVVSRIVLVDKAETVARGKALDIMQCGPVERFDTRLAGTADMAVVAGASVIVLADEHPQTEWSGEAALQTVKQATDAAPRAVVVAAGTHQRDVLAAASGELGISVTRLVGSAPLAAISAAQAMAALELDASVTDLSLTLVGVPPGWVLAWADATLDGASLVTLLTPPQISRIEARLRASWPPGPYTLGSAAAAVVAAIVTGSHRRMTCFTAADPRSRGSFVALPVTLGSGGVRAVHVPNLGGRERVAMLTRD
jgi:malate dehydrogenase